MTGSSPRRHPPRRTSLLVDALLNRPVAALRQDVTICSADATNLRVVVHEDAEGTDKAVDFAARVFDAPKITSAPGNGREVWPLSC